MNTGLNAYLNSKGFYQSRIYKIRIYLDWQMDFFWESHRECKIYATTGLFRSGHVLYAIVLVCDSN